jgi:PAS domain S-box-containing protein
MSEHPLDAVRRKIKEAEERLKSAAAAQEIMQPADTRAAEQPSVSSHQYESSFAAQVLLPGQKERLQSLQTKLDILLESSRDAIIQVNGNKGWEQENHHLREWLGYGEKEFSSLRLMDLFEPETASRLMDSFPQWLEGKPPLRQVPGYILDSGGGLIPVLVSSHAAFNEREESVAYIVFEDARLQRRLESQVEHAREFINALVREGPIPTFVMNREGAVAEANQVACEWLGIGLKEIAATQLRNFVHPSSRNDFDNTFDCALRRLPPAEAFCRFNNGSGAEFRARLFFTGVASANGTVERILGMLGPIAANSSLEWSAYGRMTPGVLSELSGSIADLIRVVLEQVRSHIKPDLKRLVKGINDARFVLSRWMESAALLPDPLRECTFANLVEQAMQSRKMEFSRWEIDASLESNAAATEVCCWPPAIFKAILHIIQWCIEQLHAAPGKRQLLIRALRLDSHLEISFLCDCFGKPAQTQSHPDGPFSLRDFEFKAAKKLVNAAGGAIVLENSSKTQQMIRIVLSESMISMDQKLQSKSQS